MKKNIFSLLMLFFAIGASAQEYQNVNLQLETRIDYQREYLQGDAVKANSGFKGKYLNVILNGNIDNDIQILSFEARIALHGISVQVFTLIV